MTDIFNPITHDRELFFASTGMRFDFFGYDGAELQMDAPKYLPTGSCTRVDFAGMTSKPFACVGFTFR